MRFIKGAVALLAVGAVAFGGSIAGTNYVLDSREEARVEAQQEAIAAQARSEIVPGVDDSVEAAANAPENRDNIGMYTVRCQVHEGDTEGPLAGFVFGYSEDTVQDAEEMAEIYVSRVVPMGESEMSHCRTWDEYVSMGAFDADGRPV